MKLDLRSILNNKLNGYSRADVGKLRIWSPWEFNHLIRKLELEHGHGEWPLAVKNLLSTLRATYH